MLYHKNCIGLIAKRLLNTHPKCKGFTIEEICGMVGDCFTEEEVIDSVETLRKLDFLAHGSDGIYPLHWHCFNNVVWDCFDYRETEE